MGRIVEERIERKERREGSGRVLIKKRIIIKVEARRDGTIRKVTVYFRCFDWKNRCCSVIGDILTLN